MEVSLNEKDSSYLLTRISIFLSFFFILKISFYAFFTKRFLNDTLNFSFREDKD
jgi:hypothetical protein